MARHSKAAVQAAGEHPHPEQRGLLSPDIEFDSFPTTSSAHENSNITSPGSTPSGDMSSSPRPGVSPIVGAQRSSSLRHPRGDGQPRTPNRVRFAETEEHSPPTPPPQRTAIALGWVDDEDFLAGRHSSSLDDGDSQRMPLLTEIEAPSITVASADVGFNAEDLLESARPKSGMRSAFMNMANSIIGAGIIGQAYAFRQAGLITGIVLLVGLTVVVDWTIQLIVINSKLSGTDSFQSTVQHCFGKPGLIAISICQWAFAFGGMLAFCIIIGDTIPTVLSAVFPKLKDLPFLWLLTNRRAVIILFVLGISYPLSLYRDIAKVQSCSHNGEIAVDLGRKVVALQRASDTTTAPSLYTFLLSRLAKASTLALISMLVILITVITQGPRTPASSRGKLSGSLLINDGIFQAIGVISFAFVCHHNSLLIYGSLRKPTLDRFAKVTHYSTTISMVACLVMALAGYLTFGDKTQGNVLNNFPSNNIVVNIARFCFGLNMLTTLPLECFVCREVMTEYFYPNAPFNLNRHLIFTSGLVLSAMTLSLFTCDLGAVFELIGATSACALAYILPPLCYIKLSTKSWKTYAGMACAVFGTVVMCITVALAVVEMVKGEGGGKTCG